jgi:hypothetical protein
MVARRVVEVPTTPLLPLCVVARWPPKLAREIPPGSAQPRPPPGAQHRPPQDGTQPRPPPGNGGGERSTTRKMIYCNTFNPLLVSAGNNNRYQ